MESISTHSITGDFSQDFCTAVLCMFQSFQNQDPSPFTNHKSISVPIEGSARAFRIIIVSRKCF